jgi:hypothetical protein
MLPLIGGVALALATLAYRHDRQVYFHVLKFLIITPWPTPFIDAQQFPALVRCFRHGVDVYVNPSCDPLGRGMDYSPLWLRADFLPRWSNWMGLVLDGGFLASLALLPPVRGAGGMIVMLLALFSSASVFALERANMDVLMFGLAAVGGWLLARHLVLRLAGYGLIGFAGLLKFYPLVLLLLFLRERVRVFIALCAVALVILGAFVWRFHGELRELVGNLPKLSSFTNGFGSREFSGGFEMALGWIFGGMRVPGPVVNVAMPHPMIAVDVLVLLGIAAFTFAAQIATRADFRTAFEGLARDEKTFLVIGATLICGCFLVGQNGDYREIHLLFVLPGLMALAAAPGVGRLFRITSFAIVFEMWGLALQQIIAEISGGQALPIGGSSVIYLYWIVRELLWWGIIAVLLAVLFCFVAESPVWRGLMRFRTRSHAG